MYDKLASKVNNIDTSEFVLKSKYQTEKAKTEKNISGVTNFVRKTKPTELEKAVPDVSNKNCITEVENKIHNARSLVKKKTNYDAKIKEPEKNLTDHNHDKYITTLEFNTLAADVFNARLAQVNVIRKTNVLMLKFQVFTEKLPQINKNIYLLKMSCKS